MKLPQVRAELLRLAEDLERLSQRVEYLAQQTKRRSPVRRAPRQRKGVSRDQVQAYLSVFPGADYEAIASAFGTNVGRVSEALNGFRK